MQSRSHKMFIRENSKGSMCRNKTEIIDIFKESICQVRNIQENSEVSICQKEANTQGNSKESLCQEDTDVQENLEDLLENYEKSINKKYEKLKKSIVSLINGRRCHHKDSNDYTFQKEKSEILNISKDSISQEIKIQENSKGSICQKERNTQEDTDVQENLEDLLENYKKSINTKNEKLKKSLVSLVHGSQCRDPKCRTKSIYQESGIANNAAASICQKAEIHKDSNESTCQHSGIIDKASESIYQKDEHYKDSNDSVFQKEGIAKKSTKSIYQDSLIANNAATPICLVDGFANHSTDSICKKEEHYDHLNESKCQKADIKNEKTESICQVLEHQNCSNEYKDIKKETEENLEKSINMGKSIDKKKEIQEYDEEYDRNLSNLFVSLVHGSRCRDSKCISQPDCKQWKSYVRHTERHSANKKIKPCWCDLILPLSYMHAENCKNSMCDVPSCTQIRGTPIDEQIQKKLQYREDIHSEKLGVLNIEKSIPENKPRKRKRCLSLDSQPSTLIWRTPIKPTTLSMAKYLYNRRIVFMPSLPVALNTLGGNSLINVNNLSFVPVSGHPFVFIPKGLNHPKYVLSYVSNLIPIPITNDLAGQLLKPYLY